MKDLRWSAVLQMKGQMQHVTDKLLPFSLPRFTSVESQSLIFKSRVVTPGFSFKIKHFRCKGTCLFMIILRGLIPLTPHTWKNNI